MRSGVEKNPGPARGLRSTFSKLSFCHWNVDGLFARDGVKISYMESIVENYDFDIFAVGESTLSDKILNDKLRLTWFTSPLFRADCKNATTRAKGGVLIYYKDHLPIKRRKDLEIVDELIVT